MVFTWVCLENGHVFFIETNYEIVNSKQVLKNCLDWIIT